RQVLEDLVRAVEARQAQAGELLTTARQMQSTLEALRRVAAEALRPADADDPWYAAALDHLARRPTAGAAPDCPLPELFRHVQPLEPSLTIGRFQDGLRCLHETARLYLHPWTGPLYEVPEPAFALLVGHEIAYYASPRAPK